MYQPRLTLIGMFLALLLTMHAAMLAGGGHSAEAHEPSPHAHHGAMAMAALDALSMSARDHVPQMQVQMPDMSECGLLGLAALRLDVAVDAAPAAAMIGTSLAARERPTVYVPIVIAFTRAQLQVFLI